MQANASMRQRARLGFLLPLILMAGCGTGEGPTPIPGTPAPPPPPITCDSINFEDGCGPFNFSDFGGGVTQVVRNPEPAGINLSDKVARMQKFAGEVFAGSTLEPPESIDFARGEAFKVKVWASRAVPMLFKFEGLNRERTLNHSGSGDWEELCFSFVGDTAGAPATGITVIFDLGVAGAAATDPGNWTFYFDDIEQVDSCPVPPPLFPVDFEGDPASYNFGAEGGFGGGVTTVIANPDPSGLNTSAGVARMQKFAGEVFAGSTLGLGGNVDFTQGDAFKVKVWASRAVPLLFKFEGLNQERTLSHTGSGGWEELCFDFAGSTAGPATSSITFIFDLGVAGAAATDPNNWTFYFDDIEQVDSCGTPAGPLFPVDFEDTPASYDFGVDGGFGGGVTTVIANPDQGGLNTSAQVARMQKFAGEVFAGSTLGLGGNVDFTQGEAFKVKVWASRAVPMLFKFEGLNQERTLSHSGSGGWEELCFDFDGSTAGPATNAITFIFDLGVAGAAATDPNNWTFYFDDIQQVASCGGGGGTTLGPVDFEPAGLGQGFTWSVFENADNPPVTFLANPDATGANTSATVARFTARLAGQPYAGTVTSDLPTFTLDTSNSCVKIKVWKTVISDVGIKFETGTGASSGDIKVPNTVTNQWEELTFDFSVKIGEPSSTDITGFVLFPDFAARTQENVVYFDDIRFLDGSQCGGGGGGGTATSVDFEGDAASYDFGPDGGFGGGVSTVVANPAPGGLNTSAQVVRMQKFAGEVYGGSTLALPAGVDWSQGETMTMKVWSQRTVPVLFKLEGLNQERSDSHDGGSAWQELCFDFTGATAGSPVTGVTVIFDLGVAGDAANDPDNWVFYYDDIQQTSGGCASQPPPPSGFATITFDDAATTYTLTDFGGNLSSLTNDPVGGTNQVAMVVKPVGAELWAGTTVSTLPGDAVPPIPLDASNTRMSIRVFSPDAGIPVRLKIENASDANVSVETEAVTTVVNTWETLVFDFANQVSGTAAFNPASTYSRVSIFFNFGTTGTDAGEKTYYFDDVGLAPAAPPPPSFATITFDDAATTYTLTDFGGNLSSLTNDPAGGTNQVAQVVKQASAELWAGTTVSTLPGDAVPAIPLDASNTRMSVRVFSPDAGIPVRLKIENASDANVSVETEAVTTVVNTWETLVFDFANQVSGTAAFNPASTYSRVSIFFNFGTTGAAAGEKTYYFDDVAVDSGSGGGGGAGDELAVNGGFETGDFSGWEIFPNNGTVTVDNTESSSGTWSAHAVAGPTQNPVLKQTRLAAGVVNPGDIINISFDMKGTAVAGGVIFPELISEGAGGAATGQLLATIVSPTAGWTTYTYTPAAGADVTEGITFQLAVVCGGDAACATNVFIDNVSVSIAP